jgi:hypothetical protein
VSIRLDDGRVISPTLQKRGELAALANSARYKFGDRLEVTCKSERYDLELKKIRRLAPAAPEELKIKESPLGEFAALEAKMTWDEVRIGDVFYVLPVADHYVYTWMSGLASGDVWTVSAQYTNHQHFQASSTIKTLP